jgi:hypothetical protein
MMNNHKKVTYTLPYAIIQTIEKRSFLSDSTMSRWLSDCIQNGYEMMIDGYYDNDKQPLMGIRRKLKRTVPKTFSIPNNVFETLSWFSKTLNIRTSHLVTVCVLDFDNRNSEGKSLRMEELMKMMNEIS